MKRAKAGKQIAAAKHSPAPKDFEECLAGVPESARSKLQQLRAAIRSVVPPEASETISYRIPAFKYKRVLVWFAAFSGHCSLFPSAAIIEEFKDELQRFVTSKGTIQFPLDQPLPVTFIKKLVKARVAQIENE
jgi:uncharacterized protein YdhG (YjbR/CyaY superfamily)